MKKTKWILNAAGEPVACDDVFAWSQWFETADRQLADDWVSEETRISTVFLGLDHNHFDIGDPILWETMIFGGPLDGTTRRYDSRTEAERGHAELVARAKLRVVN